MGTFEGWLFFTLVITLFSWGLWMGLMGILAPHGDIDSKRANGITRPPSDSAQPSVPSWWQPA